MMSIGAMGSGQGSYYIGLAREDYYLEGGEPPGRWIGEGAAYLGLTENGGVVERNAFLRLFQGMAADGSGLKYVQNAAKALRKPGWDLTFSAPKSVSVLWACCDNPDLRQAIQAAHAAAVKEACQYLQDEHAWTRRGKSGVTVEQAGLLIATFEHGTSRAQDPQLHTHALAFNLGVRTDGTIGSLVSKPFYRASLAAGTIYQVELAHQLRELGFEIERTTQKRGNTFEVKGVPRTLIDRFSTRSKEINQLLAERGEEGAKAAAAATILTRQTKQHIAREELFSRCHAVGEEYGFTGREAHELRYGRDPRNDPISVEELRDEIREVLNKATEKLTEQDSHFSGRDLLRAAMEESLETGLWASLVRTAVKNEIANNPEIQALGERNGEMRYTTREILDVEKSLLNGVDVLAKHLAHGVSGNVLEKAISQTEAKVNERVSPEAEPVTLTEEQRKALMHIVRETGGLAVLSGMAGTGKTTVLDAAREAWEHSGYRVIGAAVAGKAARGLEKGAGIESFTIAKLLASHDQTESDKAWVGTQDKAQRLLTEFKYATWQIDGKTRKLMLGEYHQPSNRFIHEWKYQTFQISEEHRDFLNAKIQPNKYRIDAKTVLVVDEAGMVGTRYMAALIAAVQKAGAKLVLVGDARQLQPVDMGGPFRAIAKRIGEVTLTSIIRQEQDHSDRNPLWRREVVNDFSEGNAAQALMALYERGFLHIAEDRKSAMQELISAWKSKGVKTPEENLIFAGTREEARELGRLAQAERQAAGLLGFRQAKIAGETIHEKDRVLFTKRSAFLGVENGDLGTVKGVDTLHKILHVTLDRGGLVLIPYKEYDSLTLGYAMTTHKGQGVTVKNAYNLCGGSMSDLHLSYVQTSRARQETHLFTERIMVWDREKEARVDRTLEQLAERMSQNRQKDIAHEVHWENQVVDIPTPSATPQKQTQEPAHDSQAQAQTESHLHIQEMTR